MNLAPIVLFVYNRQWHTQQTIEALQKNQLAAESELFIFSDGAKNMKDAPAVEAVRSYLRSISGFKKVEIIESQTNRGLADSIISGVTEIVNKYGKIIVLEDDIVTSAYFLTFMNEGLELYADVSNVYSVNGYMFEIKTEIIDTILSPLATSSWGWGTWNNKWKVFQIAPQYINEIQNSSVLSNWFNFGEFEYSNMLSNSNSWAIRWYYSVRLKNGLGVFPTKSLVKNIGFDGTGTHYKEAKDIEQCFYNNEIKLIKKNEIDIEIHKRMLDFFSKKQSVDAPKIEKSLVKTFKQTIKKFITLLNNRNFDISEIIRAIENYRIKKCTESVVIGENSKFYEQAEIINMQQSAKKIVIGKHTHIRGQLQIFKQGGNIEIGNYCYIGENSRIWSASMIKIGNEVLIAHNVNIHDNISHPINSNERHNDFKRILGLIDYDPALIDLKAKAVIIHDKVWIGFNSIILKGVTIGEGAVIGAGSVVTKNVEPYTLVVGNPARFVRNLT